MTAPDILEGMPRGMVAHDTRRRLAAFPKAGTYLEEAEFGLRRILPYLEALPPGARVLEVGSGPCIVLSELSARFPDLHLEGIEPMGDGFAYFQDFIDHMKSTNRFDVYEGGYETFPDTGPWDLVFLVNVFEHLPNWRDFLAFVDRCLSDKGTCVVLCPNYGFPYESHFHLPIVWNKAVTGQIFRDRIETFERTNDNDGLYRSLNFVTLREVRRAAPAAGLNMTVVPGIITEMIERLDTDPEFARRQSFLAGPARLLHRSGALDALTSLRFVQNRLPYMQIEFTKAERR